MGPLLVNAQINIPDPLSCGSNPCTIIDIINKITQAIVIIVVPLGTVMIIIGGFQYLTAGGSEEKANKGKKTLLYAIIGIVIALAANFLVGLLGDILGPVINQ